MSKELDALKRIRQETIPATYNQDFDKEECCVVIETALKALEVIKREPNEVIEIITNYDTWEEYIKDYPISDKTFWHIIKNKSEFDLLKEVLL